MMTAVTPVRRTALRHVVPLLLGSSSLLAAAPVLAQQSPPTQVAVADTGTPLPGEIIVTAQKRAESLQKVPISIQALGAATLEQHQVQAFDDYAKQLPSVSFQSFGPGQSQLFFRGISSGGDGLPGGALPTSGVYLDEIPVTTIGALLDVHVYDIARVEALSGPQGTLYGASSLSGTLRIITNKPDPSKFSAGYDLTGTKFGKGNAGGTAEGFVNLPISERAAIRLVGFYEHDGGYIDNTPGTRTYQRPHTNPADPDGPPIDSPLTINNDKFVKKNFNPVDTYGGRAALGIDLSDDWTATPTIIAQHQKTKGSFLYDPKAGDLEVHDFTPEHTLDKWYQAALTITGKLSNWDVLYSGGYLQRSLDTVQDYSYYTVAYDQIPGYTYFQNADGSPLDPTQVFHVHQKISKQTHELRISSPADERVRLTAGMFYQRQANQNTAHYDIPGLGSIPDTPAVWGDDIFLTRTHIVDRDYAMFGQAAFDILPNLTLTAGIRGFMARNTLTGFSGFQSDITKTDDAGNALCLPTRGTDRPCDNINKKVDEAGETHKVTLTWQVDPDRMVYATYSTGFRPGGNNRRLGINPYDADTLDNYEIGWKTRWFDRKLTLNGAFYYETWNKLQYALAPVGSVGVTNIYNAGDARVYGVEADFNLALGHLTFSGSGAYNDAKLTRNFCQVDPVTLNPLTSCSVADGDVAAPKGTRLPIQPKFKGTLTARYDRQVGDVNAFVQGSMLYQSSTRSYLGVVEGTLLGDTPSFTTFDFSLGGKLRNMSFEFFVQNAFDKRGQLSRNTVCSPIYCGPYARIYPVKPQQFGIRFGQKF